MSASVSNSEQYANHIPEGVRRASQRADAIAREVGMTNVPEDPAANTTVVEEPKGGAAAGAAAASTPPPASTPTPTPPAEDWEQRYRTLQGKYDSEIPGLRAQVSGMERLLAVMETRTAPTPQPTHVAPVTPTVVEVPAADVETFGEDLVVAARRWARAEISPEIASLRAEITELRSGYTKLETTQTNVVRATDRQNTMTNLDADPDIGRTWRATNNDPKFVSWLEQNDRFSGQKRLDLLRVAYESGDIDRTKQFFVAYQNEQTPTPGPASGNPHTPAQGTGAPTLEDLAAPGRGQGQTPTGAQQDKRIWTSRDISTFYRDVQKGAFNGREPERLRLETDIIAAATEGRVR